MDTIKQIHYNDFGTSFYWRRHNEIVLDKVQLIFRETGFYFSIQELKQFKNCIAESFSINMNCADCTLKNYCNKFLLKTPFFQVDLAVTMEELDKVNDLVEGTLFKIALNDYLFGEGMN
jgi:hypothetical protein